jgi:hypothetical protein
MIAGTEQYTQSRGYNDRRDIKRGVARKVWLNEKKTEGPDG